MRPISSPPSQDGPATARVPKSHRRSIAAAVLVGLLLSTGGGTLASAAAPAAASAASSSDTSTPGNSWLPLQVEASPYTEWHKSGLPGGGWAISLHERRGQDGVVTPATVTFTAGDEAFATAAGTLENGQMTPTKGGQVEDLSAKTADGQTVITVTSTAKSQSLLILPVEAPTAAEVEDQGALDRAWRAVVDFFTGDDEEDGSAEQEADEPSEPGDEESGAGGDQPTAQPTSEQPTPKPTSSEGSADDAETDEDDASTNEADTCVLTQSGEGNDPQAQTKQQDEDYAVSDGPSGAPTFSEETRRKAAAQADACSEPDQDGDTDSEDSGDAGNAADSGDTKGSSSGTGSAATRGLVADGDWLSGASGDRDAISDLRGNPVEIATTWADGESVHISVPQVQDGGEFSEANWDKPLLINVAPFGSGGSWAKAADGAYDEDWKQQLTNLKNGWGERDPGQLFISLGHEMNGNWYAWSVKAEETEDYRAAIKRYAALQDDIMPGALLTQTFNRESNGYDGDSSDLIVAGVTDVLGVDYYNHYPYAANAEQFEAGLNERDGGGGAKGFQAWLSVAADAGVPVVVPEWNGSGKNGDSPAFFEGMHEQFSRNAGPGAGQVLAEMIFEIDKDANNWKLTGSTRMPKSRDVYAEQWSEVGASSSSTSSDEATASDDDGDSTGSSDDASESAGSSDDASESAGGSDDASESAGGCDESGKADSNADAGSGS